MRAILAVSLAAVIAACSANGAGTSTTVNSRRSTTAPSASTLPPIIECQGTGEFGEGGALAEVVGVDSDARNLARITWDNNDQCESFNFDFATFEGAPATTVPDIRIGHLESFQVIRINMGIADAVVTDQLVETGLVDRLFVVRALDGEMFVDLHLSAPAAARARVTSSPARLTVDLRPGFAQFAGTSSIGDQVIVVSPANGTHVGPVTQFMGYARTFEANVLVIVTQGDDMVTETNTTTADHLDTWGEFRETIALPAGNVSVFFGEAGPENGSLDGVTVDLAVE
jgi:hypothetical protein